MYLYWGHSGSTSREGEQTKKATKNDMERRACRQKSNAPHTNFSVFFFRKPNLVSHKSLIILQRAIKEHIQEKAYQCLENDYIIFAQKCYNFTFCEML